MTEEDSRNIVIIMIIVIFVYLVGGFTMFRLTENDSQKKAEKLKEHENESKSKKLSDLRKMYTMITHI